MKQLIVAVVITANILAMSYMVVNYNYQMALRDASRTDGTDSSIEEAMSRRGFRDDWSHDYSFTEKIVALWNSL